MISTVWIFNVILTFSITVIAIYLLQYPARYWGWVDEPDQRKHHQGAVPLIGGVAMFIALATTIPTLASSFEPCIGLLAGMLVVVVTGVYDDFHESKASTRFVAQITATLLFVFYDGVALETLGNLLSQGEIKLHFWSIPFTLFCVVGVINAINMSDGLDGLAGGFGIVATLWLIVALSLSSQHMLELLELSVLLLLAATLSGFLCFNLRYPWHHRATVFMGDAGSMMIGLMLAWFFIRLSQGEQPVFAPISAVWIFALPLMDTVFLMTHRMLNRRSPFEPDRQHLHHLLLRIGFSEASTTAVLLIISVVLGAIGVLGGYWAIPDSVLFYGFIGLFALYSLAMNWAWQKLAGVENDKKKPIAEKNHCGSAASTHVPRL
ncbi:MAG: MraY family glycosyltransferase [Candidatus Competibacteraceae bacterium]|jgi:UDP-GlcNAc:undecaprenyl-phosphate GlcNAc-1-phosphate transferase|nr:MraY family glycosyltransferase [Candidatus Competibacteraceae bacterium]